MTINDDREKSFIFIHRTFIVVCVSAVNCSRLISTVFFRALFFSTLSNFLIKKMQKAPFSLKWTIKEDDLKVLIESDPGSYKKLESKYITTEYGVKYYLQIYPNGNREGNHGKVYVFFGMEIGNLRKVEAKYTVAIESAIDYSQKREDIFDESTVWGECFCDTDELFDVEKKFFIDGTLVLKFDGIFDFGIIHNSSTCSPSWTLNLGGLWEEDESKDFIFVVREFKSYTAIIATIFPYYDEKIKSMRNESTEGWPLLSCLSLDGVETLLKTIYIANDRIDFLSGEEKTTILEYCDKYNIQHLKDQLEGFLVDKISAATVCRIMNCSIKANATKLQEKCMKFLMDSFASKTAVANLDILDKDVAVKVLQNSLYHDC